MRSDFGEMLVIYFMTGVVVVAGGGLDLTDRNPVNVLFSVNNGTVSTNTVMVEEQMGMIGGALGPLMSATMAVLFAVLEVIKSAVKFLNWPVFALTQGGAPPYVVLGIGGTMTVMFYISIFIFIRRST